MSIDLTQMNILPFWISDKNEWTRKVFILSWFHMRKTKGIFNGSMIELSLCHVYKARSHSPNGHHLDAPIPCYDHLFVKTLSVKFIPVVVQQYGHHETSVYQRYIIPFWSSPCLLHHWMETTTVFCRCYRLPETIN